MPRLIMLDQTYIIFDVDCIGNASEVVNIRRLSRAGIVAFRFQTNVPTRYIVKPCSGVLENTNPVRVNIVLYGNRYNPNHMLLVQAVEVRSKEEAKTVWQDPNLECRDMQTIRLKLGTTVLGVDRALGFDDNSKKTDASISQALFLSRKKGKAKVQELEGMFL
ncbi:hypothetical protein Y032_0005g2588 [Ancylostoma ceylanicum]|nr:hypothetical protein Y032_0005g2588 [Ancylostoma ceylanicum]